MASLYSHAVTFVFSSCMLIVSVLFAATLEDVFNSQLDLFSNIPEDRRIAMIECFDSGAINCIPNEYLEPTIQDLVVGWYNSLTEDNKIDTRIYCSIAVGSTKSSWLEALIVNYVGMINEYNCPLDDNHSQHHPLCHHLQRHVRHLNKQNDVDMDEELVPLGESLETKFFTYIMDMYNLK